MEGSPLGEPIPLRRETVTAFVGPAPRGPADIPVAVRSVAEFRRRFGCSQAPSRLELALGQFFDNGGRVAVVVRVCRSQYRARIYLPSARGNTVLEAACPGRFEHLRASVDYDGITEDRPEHFNLIVQRLESASRPLVVEQEIHARVSVDPQQGDYVGDALLQSSLVRLVGAPAGRPERTVGLGVSAEGAYVYGDVASGPRRSVTDYDLVGSAAEGTGLYALEQLPYLDLLCLVPPAPGHAVGPVALFAAERYCQRRQALLIVDPPADWQGARDVVADHRSLALASPNVVTYFPQPSRASLVGAIAGAIARGDTDRRAWLPSRAALSLRGRFALDKRLGDSDAALLARVGVNAVLPDGHGRAALHGLVTGGRRSGLSDEWSSLGLRRGALYILGNVVHASRWGLFKTDDEFALAEIRQQLVHFLEALRRAGALQGRSAADAWELIGPGACDGRLVLDLGIALRRPGEFLGFRVAHAAGECRVREFGWEPRLARAG